MNQLPSELTISKKCKIQERQCKRKQNLHQITKRATPEMYCNYKLSLSLHQTFNHRLPNFEWINLNFEQVTMARQAKFHVNKMNVRTIGMNALCNRFHFLNDKIPLEWLNKSFGADKVECKKLFLSYN